MALVLQIFAIVISVLFNIVIFHMLKKGRLELQYTLLWIFAGLAILIMSIWPQVLIGLASLLGIQVPMNAAFFLGIDRLPFLMESRAAEGRKKIFPLTNRGKCGMIYSRIVLPEERLQID